MSDANEPLVPRGSGTTLHGEQSSVDAVKDESAAVAHTATDAAKDVGRVTKDEAASVMNEARGQIQGLYEQTRSELTDEASKQQERVATGLQTIGDDLDSMARSSQEDGLARELVRETSQRVNRVATWLNEREPGDLLDEVKSFARRQPGVFIGVAAIAGAVAGRLTRALASNAHDEHERTSAEPAGVRTPAVASTTAPVYRQGSLASESGTAGTAGTAGAGTAGTAGATGVMGAHGAQAPLVDPEEVGADAGAAPRPGPPGVTGAPGATGAPTAPREEGWNERPHTI